MSCTAAVAVFYSTLNDFDYVLASSDRWNCNYLRLLASTTNDMGLFLLLLKSWQD